jgi:hypothetical protein
MLKTLKVPGSEAPYPDLTNTDKERQVNLLEGGGDMKQLKVESIRSVQSTPRRGDRDSCPSS